MDGSGFQVDLPAGVYRVHRAYPFNSKLELAILPILLFVCMANSYCSNPLVHHCGTVPGPLHAPQLESGAHSAGSITSGKTHHEVILAGIIQSSFSYLPHCITLSLGDTMFAIC